MKWPKHLKVDKKIVPLLSRATYENFPRALRELVSNAYDADATKVTITIEDDQIIVEDNGNGMTPDQFDFFLRIAGSERKQKTSSKYKRKRIGQFGVGFLAAFPFTNKLEIISTAENSNIIFHAIIPTEKFMKQEKHLKEVQEIEILGNEFLDASKVDKHFTKIVFFGITELVETYFSAKPEKVSSTSIKSWDGIKRLKWELEEMLPLNFPENSKFNEMLKYPEPLSMDVWLNEEQLFRNDPVYQEILERHSGMYDQIGDLKFKYVITNNNRPVKPVEAKGLKIRVSNVGVGSREYFGLNVIGKTFRNLHWLSGEVHILDGLDDAIALNRDQITWNADYDELAQHFRRKLAHHSEVLGDVRDSIRSIESAISSKLTSPVIAKREIIAKNVKQLEKKGYSVKESKRDNKKAQNAVTIDTVKKVVTVNKSHPSLKDRITIAKKKYRVEYLEWKYKDTRYPACRFGDKGNVIEINTEYPLFKTKRYGELFKRLSVLLLVAERDAKSKKEMIDFITNNLMSEFSDII